MIKVINVDDEFIGIKIFEQMIQTIPSVEYLGGFNDPYIAINFVKENEVDIAFLDIEMAEVNGIELARQLKKINDDIQIVFVTGHDQYALEAFHVEAIGYLLKPYALEDVERIIHRASKISKVSAKRMRIQTFGHFNVFIDDKVVVFSSQKSKELFAVLVDRKGEVVSMESIIDILWEDRVYDERVKMLYRQCTSQLRRLLNLYDLSDVVVVNRGSCYLDTTKVDCDYYRLLNKDKSALQEYTGKYMFDYSWAEETNYLIDELVNELKY